MLKYKDIFQIKYTEEILSNSTRKLLWFEIKQNADCSFTKKKKFIVLLIIIFGTLSFPINIIIITAPILLLLLLLLFSFLQCFDTVGWVAGRASGL